MQFTLDLDIAPLKKPITYGDGILLIGSCFSENMSERLRQFKFRQLSNPHGILFNPLSVTSALNGYAAEKQYAADELFQLNELWNSWDHHTKFSDIDAETALTGINNSQKQAADMVRSAGYIIITLGSAFQYYLRETGKPVSNNHRAPAQWFEKRLLSIDTITASLSETLTELSGLNPGVQFIFTVSPVRHIRDGVVDNNRSKARLLESVHEVCSRFSNSYYFPAYELMIDILRDYRFYDIDFVHPNYLATSYIWERFVQTCLSPETQQIMKEVQDITTAHAHRPRFPQTEAHRNFKKAYAAKIADLQARYPFLDLEKESEQFTGA